MATPIVATRSRPAAALASLEVFENEQVLAGLPAKIDRLAWHRDRIGRHKHVGDIRQCGLIAGVELVLDRAKDEPFPWRRTARPRSVSSGTRKRRALAPAGRYRRDHAAAGDIAGRTGSNLRGRRAWHRAGHSRFLTRPANNSRRLLCGRLTAMWRTGDRLPPGPAADRLR